ncbi:hypothetical protein Tco_1343381 [Tanacetum coccineum]
MNVDMSDLDVAEVNRHDGARDSLDYVFGLHVKDLCDRVLDIYVNLFVILNNEQIQYLVRITEHSTVTYTSVLGRLQTSGSPGSMVHLLLPMVSHQPPNYIITLALRDHHHQLRDLPRELSKAPPSPIYISFVWSVFRSSLPVVDEGFPAEEQPLGPAAESHLHHQSPGYLPEVRPLKRIPEEVFDEVVLMEDSSDYPAWLSIPTPCMPAPFLFREVAERLFSLPTPPPSPLFSLLNHHSQYPLRHLPLSSPQPHGPTYVEGSLDLERPRRNTPGPGYEVGESSAAGAARQVRPATAGADLYGFADMPFHRPHYPLMDVGPWITLCAWAQSMDACNQTRSEGISLRTTVMAQQSEITELQAADRRRQTR